MLEKATKLVLKRPSKVFGKRAKFLFATFVLFPSLSRTFCAKSDCKNSEGYREGYCHFKLGVQISNKPIWEQGI